jgi:glycogen(starch) synthase
MRILFWNHMFLPALGGVETFTARLARELLARGHEVMIATTWNDASLPERHTLDGIQIARLPFHKAMRGDDPPAMARTLMAAAALKREYRPDVVHVHFADPNVFFHLRTANAHAAPMVVTFHVPVPDGRTARRGIVDEVASRAHTLITVTAANARSVATALGVPLARIQVVSPGVPVADFVPSPEPNAGAARFVFVGRLVHDKGCDLAVEALAMVRAARWDARLRVVGTGPEIEALGELVAARGLRESVEWLGGIAPREVPGAMSDAAAVLVPSRYQEPFGMVAVEAALMRRPVIAAAVGGLPEIVEHERTGLLFLVNDPLSLAAQMIRILADPAAARAMGAAARPRALSHFTMNGTVEKYIAIYTAASDSARHASGHTAVREPA